MNRPLANDSWAFRPVSPLAVIGLLTLCLLALGACTAPPPDDSAEAAPELEPAGLEEAEIVEPVAAALDRAADPCNDFYRYACGGWMDTTELPGDQARWGRSFSTIMEANRETLKEILEGAAAAGESDRNQALVGAFYGSCMDEETLEKRGTASLDPHLAEIAGLESLEGVMEMAGRLHRWGVDVFFAPLLLPDFKRPTHYLTYYSQGGLGLPERDYYLREDERSVEVRQAYQDYVARILTLTGTAEADAAQAAEEVLAFETQLAEASRPAVEMRNMEALYNKVDLEGLKELAPSVPWEAYQKGTGFPGVEELVVTVPEFFEALEEQLTAADLDVLRTYLRFHLAGDSAPFLSSEMEQASFDFNEKVLSGRQEMEPRWKRCADSTDGHIGEALGQLFVEKRFAGDSKEIAVEMIKRVEDAFEANLPQLAWMDDVTRAAAVEKVHAVANKIGYPDEWRDYSSLELSENDYLGNAMAATAFEYEREHRRAGQPVDDDEWRMTPPTVNAYYNPTMNEIVFPAGILQPPVFHRDFPAAMSYGGMGAVVGHELTHGFDDSGRKFNAEGELKEWWQPEVADRFEERTECVADLYDTYEVEEGLNVNGRLTLGENVADLGGVKASYNALKAQLGDDLTAESIVPGLTNEQLFFVSYGQVWCSLYTPEYQRLQVQTDPHSPSKFRVNGPLSNLPAFADAFSCADGAAMKRDPVCEVW